MISDESQTSLWQLQKWGIGAVFPNFSVLFAWLFSFFWISQRHPSTRNSTFLFKVNCERVNNEKMNRKRQRVIGGYGTRMLLHS